jgi:hypothetical protein
MSTSSMSTASAPVRSSRRRISRLLGAVVLATMVAAPTQTSAAVAAGHHHRHASHATCPAELRELAATMQRLTGHVTSCQEAAALLRKGR